MKQIIILGAGISGLTAAWQMKKTYGSNVNIRIIEKSSRAGGWIKTTKEKGFLFEQGSRSCRTAGTGRATLQLIEELGLQDQVITADSEAQKRYLFVNGKLKRVPWGLASLGKYLLPALWRDWKEATAVHDESIRDFITRRLHTSFADYLFDPMTTGIYAGDISKLSIRSCFPKFYEWEQECGSVIRGAWKQKKKPQREISPFIKQIEKSSLFSLKQGMESLIKELVKQLEIDIQYNSNVVSVEENGNGVTILLPEGRSVQADYVISTLPSSDLHYTSVIVVNVGYSKPLLSKKGFGYLIPSNQNESVLGCVWDSAIFPQQNIMNETRLTLMLGGENHIDDVKLTTSEIQTKVLEALERHMGITSLPDAISIKMAKQAIPQYTVGHLSWATQKQLELSSKIIWIGTAFNGVSVNDCIAHAKNCQFS
jgi:oxygen-dependent protoporphyrinogen oxidase